MDLVNDALPLEYKLMNRRASGDLQLSDPMHDPLGQGVVWISCYGFKEELADFLLGQVGPLRDDCANLALIGHESIQSFA